MSTTEVKKRSPRPFSEAEKAFIREHVREGWSAVAIAEALGRQSTVVLNRIRAEGLDYKSFQGVGGRSGRRRRTPRIVGDDAAPRVAPEMRRKVISAARRTGTLADTARETGLDRFTVERVLAHDAPHVLRLYVRASMASPGRALANFIGDAAKLVAVVRDQGLCRRAEFDELIEDYGVEQVQAWHDGLQRDRDALRVLARDLRHALARATNDTSGVT
jgi:hypothetical protein